MAEPERICANCAHWVPNGGVLGYGYCSAKKWVYRKPTQTKHKRRSLHR